VQRLLLVLLFAASYLLFAGGPSWTLYPLLGIAALGVLAAPARTFAFPAATRLFDLSLLLVLAALGLQLVPLPSAVVAAVSPHAEAITAAIRLTLPGAAAPSWRTLSVDPSLTLVSLGTVALGALSYWLARAVFSAGGGTRMFLKAMTFLGVLAAVMAVVQKAVTPRGVLFMLVPEARSASPFGAFINRNHFAAWLLMTATPVIGYAIARLNTHPRRGRWRESIGQVMASGLVFTMIAVSALIGVLIMTLSRSGLAALGTAAVVGWAFGAPRVRLSRSNMPAVFGVVGAAAIVALLFVDVDKWAERFEQSFNAGPTPFSRTTIWRESLPIISDFWPAGTGAGTYSDAMTVYQQTRVWVGSMQQWAHFNNAHSFYVQVAAEGGVLLAVPALLALLSLAAVGIRAVGADKGEMFWVRVGAAAGLAGLAVQSIWEVALIMPANAVLAGILAGLLLYQREPIARRAGGPIEPPPLPLRMAR
jgi:hypothetical protein